VRGGGREIYLLLCPKKYNCTSFQCIYYVFEGEGGGEREREGEMRERERGRVREREGTRKRGERQSVSQKTQLFFISM